MSPETTHKGGNIWKLSIFVSKYLWNSQYMYVQNFWDFLALSALSSFLRISRTFGILDTSMLLARSLFNWRVQAFRRYCSIFSSGTPSGRRPLLSLLFALYTRGVQMQWVSCYYMRWWSRHTTSFVPFHVIGHPQYRHVAKGLCAHVWAQSPWEGVM